MSKKEAKKKLASAKSHMAKRLQEMDQEVENATALAEHPDPLAAAAYREQVGNVVRLRSLEERSLALRVEEAEREVLAATDD